MVGRSPIRQPETNFIHVGVSERDKELLFGPIEEWDVFLTFGDLEKLCHLMFRAGLFPSISEARRAGWDKPVPKGWSEFVVGKKRHHVWILNTLPQPTIQVSHDDGANPF